MGCKQCFDGAHWWPVKLEIWNNLDKDAAKDAETHVVSNIT
jgi:hypothetical protein